MSRKKIFLLCSVFFIILSQCLFYSFANPTLPETYPQYLAINHGTIQYYRLGQGSPVVLIAGYATDVSSWDQRFLATLAEEHEVIVFNNRNVDDSQIHSDSYTSQDLAQDTYALIQGLGLKKPAIIGISMGGMIAQQLSVLHQHELGSLILINTAIAGSKSIRPSQEVINLMQEMPRYNIARLALALRIFFPHRWAFSMALALIKDRFIPKDYREVPIPDAILNQQKNLILSWSLDNKTAQKLAQVTLPTLIFSGGEDIVLPPKNSDVLVKTFPNAKLVRLPEGGHAMIFQFPTKMAQTINAFLIKGH